MPPDQLPEQLTCAPRLSDHLQVLLAEYNAMRAEILQLSNKQMALLTGSFLVTGFAFTSADRLVRENLIKVHGVETMPFDFVHAAVIFTLVGLGLLYCDYDRAIIRCATYVEGWLRLWISVLLEEDFVSCLRQKVPPTPRNLEEYLDKKPKLLAWETYIRKGLPILHKFPARPRTAPFQGLFMLIPACLCFTRFVYLEVWGGWQIQPYIAGGVHVIQFTSSCIVLILAITWFSRELIRLRHQRLEVPAKWEELN